MRDQISMRGRTARKIVQVVHQLPYFGSKAQDGEWREKWIEREKQWKCPAHLERTILPIASFPTAACAMEFLQQKDGEPAGIILQLHGGGYYGRLHNTYRDMAVLYHELSGGYGVLSVDYRVAPKDPFPAAFEDAVRAYCWILDKGYSTDRLFVVGDSAGGGLALALALYLRDEKMPLPKGIVTMSAWTDLTLSGASYVDCFDVDPIFGKTKDSLLFHNVYVGKQDPHNPYISPLYGCYEGLPPMLMQVGEYEMLRSDTLTVAQKARQAGVDVQEQIYPGMFHVFQMGLLRYPESRKAWNEVAQFIHRLS